MNRRVSIITINDRFNYGNRLQNYALRTVVSQWASVEVPHIHLAWHCRDGKARARIHRLMRPLRRVRADIDAIGPQGALRFIRFEHFTNSYAPETKTIFPGPLETMGACFPEDKVIIGSDQVWNYHWLSPLDLEIRLGGGIPREKLVAYAASIGVDDIEDEWVPIFREGLRRIPRISVREDRAAELISQVSGREASVVLDPTLLLTKEQWTSLSPNRAAGNGGYALTYFLGTPSAEQSEFIRSWASAHGLDIRKLNDPSDPAAYALGPLEFIDLVRNARCVFTDSYHACCFSILFSRPFKVFNRNGLSAKENMSSRMRTLFRLFDIEDAMGSDSTLPNFNWPAIAALLDKHRAQSLAWLRESLDVPASPSTQE